MKQRMIVHLVRVAGDPQRSLDSGVHLDADGAHLAEIEDLAQDVLSDPNACISGWDQKGDWVCIPGRSVEAITVQGFERAAAE